jgi:hypothetical protein
MDLGRHLLGRLHCTTPVSTPLSSSWYVVAIRSIWDDSWALVCVVLEYDDVTRRFVPCSPNIFGRCITSMSIDRSLCCFKLKQVLLLLQHRTEGTQNMCTHIYVWWLESSKKHAHPRTSLVQFGSLSSSKYYIFITSQNIFCNYICMQLAV